MKKKLMQQLIASMAPHTQIDSITCKPQ